MTNLPKFLALAALLAGCGDYARTGTPPANVLYFPTGIAVGHVPAGCSGGDAGCQTRLYVASSNFDLRYDLDTGGAVTAIDPDTGTRVGEPVHMGSFAGDLALVDPVTCPGWSAAPMVLVTSRSANRLYNLTVGADGAPACSGTCSRALDPHLRDPFTIAVGCSGAGDLGAWVSFLATYNSAAWAQRLDLGDLSLGDLRSGSAFPAQAMTYDPSTRRMYWVTLFSGTQSSLIWADAGNLVQARSFLIPIHGEAVGVAISADGTRAYVALRLFDGLAAQTGMPVQVGGALAILDLTEQPTGGPAGTVLGIAPLGLGASYVRAVDRRALGLRDLVAVTCTDDATLHLYDDEVGAVLKVVGADARGAPLLGRRPYGLAVEAPFRTATSTRAARFFVASFDDNKVTAVQVDDLALPGAATVLSPAITPADP